MRTVLELRIPSDVGAEIRTEGGFLSKCCRSGFTKTEGDTYYSDNLDRAGKVIRFDIQNGIGNVKVRWM